MKLPDNKQERIKVLALIGIGVVLALYGIYAGIITPIGKRNKEARAGIADYTEKLDRADTRIRQIRSVMQNNAEIAKNILDAADQHVLKPRLGNYLIGAKEIIEKHSRAANVEILTVDEIGISSLPEPGTPSRVLAFKIYAARAVARTGFDQLMRLFESLETENPRLCVSAIEIHGRAEDPETHDITFEVQWPVWANTETEIQLRRQLKEAKDEEQSHVEG